MFNSVNNYTSLPSQVKLSQPSVNYKDSNIIRPAFCGAQDAFSETETKEARSGWVSNLFTKIISLFKSDTPKAEIVNITEHAQKVKKAGQLIQDIGKIIAEDQQREVPVLKKFDKETLNKIVQLVFRPKGEPALIGVSGGSASGKTTLAKDIVEKLNRNATGDKDSNTFAQILSQDNYYYDFSKEIKKVGVDKFFLTKNVDHPRTVELDLLAKHIKQIRSGETVKIPEYKIDGTGLRVDNKIPIKPTPLIFVEGMFTLTSKPVSKLLDLKVFVDASKEVRSKRWWDRAPSRNIKNDDAGRAMYNRAFTMHDKFVEPGKEGADIVINSEANFADSKKVMTQLAKAIAKQVSFAGKFFNINKVA